MKPNLQRIIRSVAASIVLLAPNLLCAQIAIPTTFSLPSSAADTSKPGFIWRVHQVNTGQPNSVARAEAQLAGDLGNNTADPSAQGNASGTAQAANPVTAPISFDIATVINLDQAGGSNGNFQPDEQMPGIPGTDGSTDNIAAEALTWLDLPAGDLTMGVNSDDGFRLTIGGASPVDKFNPVQVGIFDGGRGAANSEFRIRVAQAGLYAARLVWFEGGGGANVEWYTLKADNTRVLVNDVANGGIKAYRAATGLTAAVIRKVVPAPSSAVAAPNQVIEAEIEDAAKPVVASSVSLELDGVKVNAAVTKSGNVTSVKFTPPARFASLSKHTVKLSYTDDSAKSVTWDFTVAKYATLTPAMKVAADTSKPGFIWRVSQVGTAQPNTNDRTENQLAGLLVDADGNRLKNLADPNAAGVARAPAAAASPAHAPITFEIERTINMSQGGGDNAGNFQPDDVMPGIPGLEGGTDSIAAELITYLDLPAGIITMGVNSDDGFRTTAGQVNDVFNAVLAGEFNGGRGAADTTFSILIEEAGIYPFRTTWEEGGGGANIEWFTVQQGGKKVLINDAANGGVKAYRAAAGKVDPSIKTVSPAPGSNALNQPARSLTILLTDGSTPVDDKSLALTLNGKSITPTVTREGSIVRISYAPTTLQVPGIIHEAKLTFKDTSGAFTRTQEWRFRNLKNVVLPASPVVVENFESTAEGKVPDGWVEKNFTSNDTAGQDIDNLKSDTYKGWVVVDRARLEGLKARIFNTVAPGQTLNGQPITTLGEGKILYAESDVRAADQIQFLTSKSFDLSKVSKAVLAIVSLYEQNQDSIGALEYSIDDGKTWLPVVYYLDPPDIKLTADGAVDAVRTLKDNNADTAAWTEGGQTFGDNYGAFILAPITDALAPFIEPRINDDPTEGKRLEIFRLSKADGQANVKFRFAYGGTASWYWGVDNLAVYDVPTLEEPTGAPSTPPGMPKDFGQLVNGFQDDFTGATRDPNWKPRGPGGDLYRQEDGMLRVTVRANDPNHLLYEAPGYNNSVQEVLARIRITAFGVNQDGPRAGLGTAVATNNSQGINLHFRNFAQDNVPGRQFKLLDDARAWGPPGLKIDWTTNTWYWMRLRHEPNAAGGTNDVFGKVWVADGATPEPENWQLTWNYIPARSARTGFAGITGSSIDGIGNFEVDYILIKAEGLPQIKVDMAPTGPAPTAPAFTGLAKTTGNRLILEWKGVAALEQADDVAGPWTAVAGAATPRTITLSGTGKFYRLRP